VLAKRSIPVIPWYLVDANTSSQLKYKNIDKWVIKPIDGMKGISVLTNINLEQMLHILSKNREEYFFVEPYILGQTFRVLLLNNKVISAYKTHPPKLVGDGICTVGTLLNNWLDMVADNYKNIMSYDADIENTLRSHNITIDNVPRKGDQIQITGVVNICRGATWERVLPCDLNKDIVEICVDASNTVGLRLVGIDIIATENDIFILETNPSPGLYGHTVELNSKQYIKRIDLSISQEVLKEAITYFCGDITFNPPKFTSISYDEYVEIRKEYIAVPA